MKKKEVVTSYSYEIYEISEGGLLKRPRDRWGAWLFDSSYENEGMCAIAIANARSLFSYNIGFVVLKVISAREVDS